MQTRGASRISRAARSRNHAAQQGAILRSRRQAADSRRRFFQPNGDSQWTLAARMDDDSRSENKCGRSDHLADRASTLTTWMSATVPGTVLTTMVDRGVYPDPDYGLNNLAIPESLNKQDYWYRVEFHAPTAARGRRLTLTFEGINYAAEVWLNGQSLGSIKGAFIRGVFDVTDYLKSEKAECSRRAGLASASSRNPARTIHQGRSRRERRHHVSRRPHLRRHRRLGLDSRGSRP